jgi:membrane-associated protease RseP (regulator of RpoE activity)
MRLTKASAATVLSVLCLAATPAWAQSALNQLESQLRGAATLRTAEPGFLGLIADDRNENNGGVRVLDCMPGGPADASGLKPGDLITSVGTTTVRSMNDFAAALRGLGPGAILVVQVQRVGVPTSVSVQLGRRPTTSSATAPSSSTPATSTALSPPTNTTVNPPLPDPSIAGSSDASRIDALEKRIEELERRLADFEQANKGPMLRSP